MLLSMNNVCSSIELHTLRDLHWLEEFMEATLWNFEGRKFPIQKNYVTYLTNLYGDYMWIQPAEKREIHVVSKLNFWRYGENESD